MSWHEVEIPADAAEGTIVGVELGGKAIALVRAQGRWFAVDDLCTHSDCKFSEDGELYDGTALCCTCHGAEFDVTTGAVLQDPATEDLPVFEVDVADGVVRVKIGDGE